MNNKTFMTRLGAAFALIFVAFYLWQTPGWLTGKLTPAEIDRHLATADKLTFPDGTKERILKRVRAWAEADDGKPFYMLNLMRHYPQLKPMPGVPELDMTPQEANAYYEAEATKLLVPNGGSLPYGSDIHDQALIPIGTDAAFDNWSRVLVVRYPSRRAFLELLSDPRYAPLEPYKMMALEVLLVPTAGDVVAPDLRLALGATLLLIFLAVGWRRAARRAQTSLHT